MRMRLTDEQAHGPVEYDGIHPGLVITWMEGPSRSRPISTIGTTIYRDTDDGEMWMYVHPWWNKGPLSKRPRKPKWAGIPWYDPETGNLYIWM